MGLSEMVGNPMEYDREFALEEMGTSLKGTNFRVNQIVRGTCVACGDEEVLLFDELWDEALLCAGCSRERSAGHEHHEVCDDCGLEGAWRDPVSRKNQFRCARCHGAAGTVFQNRWAGAESQPLGVRDKAKCSLADYGTECKGEVKPRGGVHRQALVCNKHAGVKSANERNN